MCSGQVGAGVWSTGHAQGTEEAGPGQGDVQAAAGGGGGALASVLQLMAVAAS